MKFLVPNYSCLQNPWLAGYRPQIPVLSVLCPQLNLLNPPNKIPRYATVPVPTECEAEWGPIAHMDVMEKQNKTKKLIPITVFVNIFHWTGFRQFNPIRAFTDGSWNLQPIPCTPSWPLSSSVRIKNLHKFLVFSCVLHVQTILSSFIFRLKIIMLIKSQQQPVLRPHCSLHIVSSQMHSVWKCHICCTSFCILTYLPIYSLIYLLTYLITYLLTHVLTYLLILITYLHIYLLYFTYLLTYLLTYVLTYVHTYLLTHSLTHSFTHSLTHIHTYLFTLLYLLTYLLTYLFTFLLTCLLTYLLTHSLTHSLTH